MAQGNPRREYHILLLVMCLLSQQDRINRLKDYAMAKKIMMFQMGMFLVIILLTGCQQRGDNWYCITLPDIPVPDPREDVDVSSVLDGKLPTGNLPLHATDIQEIRQAVRSEWRDDAGEEWDFDDWNVTFNHGTPGKVLVMMTSKTDRARAINFVVYHTAEGWKAVAVWLLYS